jgi:hypothetical protein
MEFSFVTGSKIDSFELRIRGFQYVKHRNEISVIKLKLITKFSALV